MSINNFNHLPKLSAHDLGKGSAVGGVGNAPATAAPVGRQPNSLGSSTDWFSQLDSGSALPISASDKFGKNPPLDLIVDSIMESLGLQD